jgi:hypothetical protein
VTKALLLQQQVKFELREELPTSVTGIIFEDITILSDQESGWHEEMGDRSVAIAQNIL